MSPYEVGCEGAGEYNAYRPLRIVEMSELQIFIFFVFSIINSRNMLDGGIEIHGRFEYHDRILVYDGA
jgi:hypothetical protein